MVNTSLTLKYLIILHSSGIKQYNPNPTYFGINSIPKALFEESKLLVEYVLILDRYLFLLAVSPTFYFFIFLLWHC